MRELREFRAHHQRFTEAGVAVAGISLDTVEEHRRLAQRLRIPYPLLSDEERAAGRAFGVLRRVGVGSWSVEFLKRSTFLVDDDGRIAAVWPRVKVRGQAAEVFDVARVLVSSSTRSTEPRETA